MWNNHQSLNLLSRLLFFMVAIVMLYAIGLRLVKPPYFPIEAINVQSIQRMENSERVLQHVTREKIDDLFRNEIEGNFISVDLTAVREAFTKLPWVREARINREWPNSLNVVLEEHQVLAYWGSHALVNTYGEVFRVTVDADLPRFIGPNEASAQEVARKYQSFNKVLLPLQQYVTEISLTPRYAWRIQLNTGTILELGRDDMEERLARYVSIYNQRIALLNQHEPLTYVDLRYQSGFAIRTSEELPHLSNKLGKRKET